MSKWNVLMVGAGVMGRGLAEVFASRGIPITLYDAFPEQMQKAQPIIKADLQNFAEQNLLTAQQAQSAEGYISYEEQLENIAPKVNLVIEGVFENAEVKRDIFSKLDRLCTPDCIFCSNTSGSNVFEIAQVSHPERLLITHFFNPPFVMPLVEIVAGDKTSPQVLETVKELIISLGKEPAVINTYVPGFIVNRLDNAVSREIGYMVAQGWTTVEDVERAIKYTSGTRYGFEGPMTLHDVVGWDIINAVSKDVYKTLCNDTEGDRLAESLVAKGHLGLKTQKGCYDYEGVDVMEYMKKRSRRIAKMLNVLRTLDDPE